VAKCQVGDIPSKKGGFLNLGGDVNRGLLENLTAGPNWKISLAKHKSGPAIGVVWGALVEEKEGP